MRKSNDIRPSRIFAICVATIAFVGVSFSTPSYGEPESPQGAKRKSEVGHVYLLRGLFNGFSIGMEGIRTKVKQRGINATIHTHLDWETLADEAISDYRRGRVGTLVIMGHSAGAVNAVDMANRIGVSHLVVARALDKSDVVQDWAIDYTLKAKKIAGPPAPAKIPATATRATIGDVEEMAPPLYRGRIHNLIRWPAQNLSPRRTETF